MKTKITRDGKKNVVVMVWGEVDEMDEAMALHIDHVQDDLTGFKLDRIVYAIEGGAKVRLAWSEDGVIMPLEGRGILNYYDFDSIQPSTQGQALMVNATGSGAFHLVLDCTKMGV